ncbi:hypothetical protein EI77_03056 [Prosthecobacter fusiformis]|uniref:BNR repeat neuraminidase n=1 Tax=Prosthecobacter fusiformis TaxID=48464 RepID=A0A4V3FF44_9BACT|nr:hypothetical protein EI77_03056 [Prosthecobacter fusiformis]
MKHIKLGRWLPFLSIATFLLAGQGSIRAQDPVEKPKLPNGEISSRSFVDQSMLVSKFTTEQYAHQSSMRIVNGMGYVVYQCNENTPEENQAGQVARMAVFNILNPTATATWVDVAQVGETSDGVTIGGTFVSGPMLHILNEKTLRIFFVGRLGSDTISGYRAFYKDYDIATGKLAGFKAIRCTIGKDPSKVMDLAVPAIQAQLDFLFGAGFGEQFARGISTPCDFTEFDGQLYSSIQIKNSVDGVTKLMTNVLMRSSDQGQTWELMGAPDPRLLTTEVKILAEPAITQDRNYVYLHLRTNVVEGGYVLCKTKKSDLYTFDAPVKKWTYGIGRPTIANFGKPIGMVAMFTAASVPMGGNQMTRNKCDVVQIDPSYKKYTKAFSIVDYNAVNTPFMFLYRDEMFVSYSTGRRRLHAKFGTSEIVFSKLRREFFVPTE